MAESEQITKKRKVIRSEGREIIARVYHFLKDEYEFMKTFNHDCCDLSPLAKLVNRTANATGVSESTVTKILKEEKDTNGKFVSPMENRRKRTSKFDFDSSNIEIIRSTVENYHVDYKEEPTLTKLRLVLRDKVGFDGCSNSLRTFLLKLGYKIQKVDNKRIVQKIPQKKIKVIMKPKGKPKADEEGLMEYKDEEESKANEERLNTCKVEEEPKENEEGLNALKVENEPKANEEEVNACLVELKTEIKSEVM